MPITRPSNYLKNKINIHSVNNRINEATAEDFKEICDILEEIIDVIELFNGSATPNDFYGVYTSLAILQATYPTATAGGYAIVDAGVGNNPQIALWDDNDNIWVLQVTTEAVTEKTFGVGDNVTNILVTDADNNEHIIVSGTYEGPDKDKLESYSVNSITRQL